MADSQPRLARFLRTGGAAAACFAGFALPLAAQVTGSPAPEVVAIRWPKLQPLAVVDEEVRVGLQMSPDLATKNLTGYMVSTTHRPPGEARHTDHYFLAKARFPAGAEGTASLDEILVVDLARGFEARLREVMRKLFPSSQASPQADGSDVELLLHADMDARWQTVADDNVAGIEVHLQLDLSTPNGEHLETLRGFGFARPEERTYRATATRWRSAGLRALTMGMEQLVDRLRASAALATAIADAAAARTLPAGLETALEFDDRGSLLPNGRLDAGEQALVRVRIANRGPGPAYGITLKAIADLPAVSAPVPDTVGTLAPGARRELTFPVAGGPDLPAGLLHLRVETAEKRGHHGEPAVLEVTTAPLVRPRLEIVDVAWNDRDGRSVGDGDGQPANGETLEAIVRVRNAGPGEAAGVVIAMSSQAKVELLEPRTTISRIAANQVGETRALVRLPAAYEAPELGLVFEAVDGRGPQSGRDRREISWPVRAKRPSVVLSSRFHDGTSPDSLGNGDGRIDNGERIELVLTATNHGDLLARDVRVTVATSDKRLVAKPSALALGNLPARNEGFEQRLLLDVPRGFGEVADREIRLALKLSQLDFPRQEMEVSLPFHHRRPDFVVEPADSPVIPPGTSGTVDFQLLNSGELTAEDVVVEVSTLSGGVELLDDRGLPSAKRRFVVGSLAAGAAGAPLSLSLRAQAGTVGPHPVTIAVLQRDFPSATRRLNVEVQAHDAPNVSASRSSDPQQLVSAGTAVPAPPMVSFLRFADGQQVPSETVLLGFEVQSMAEPLDVRATQNGRQLRLDGRRHSSGGGSPHAAQYELPVQLAPGENRFEVVVLTREGIRRERTLTLIRKWQKPRLWVAAIGVGRYADRAIEPLQFAAADARDVHDYFARTFDLPPEQRFLLVDERATLREMKSLLGTRLAAQANNPEDTVIIYFAGHGWAESGAGSADSDRLSKYLLPHDTVLGDPYSTALDVDEVTNVVRRLVPERVVVIIDSCFSGAAGGRSPFDPNRDRLRGVVTEEFLDRMEKAGKGRVVLTASRAHEVAGERVDLGHGIFTYYLLAGLGGDADINHNSEIDVDELYDFVFTRVTELTRGKQNPVKRSPHSVGPIVIGRAAAQATSALP